MDCPQPSTLVEFLYFFSKLLAIWLAISTVFFIWFFTIRRQAIKEMVKKVISNRHTN